MAATAHAPQNHVNPRRRSVASLLLALAAIVLPYTGARAESACPGADVKTLTGAGSTFDAPLFTKMFDEYGKLCNVKVTYNAIGSGGGIRQLQEMTVDFGASDGPMNDKQKAEAKGGAVLHVPVLAGAEAVTYNLEGVPSGALKLTPEVLADIYLKKIHKWNDPHITAINPGIKLPNEEITVVHRWDGSGTTFIFTNYLAKVSKEWSDKVGFGTTVEWPGDIGGAGNDVVAKQVTEVPGAIGYVELAFAVQNKMPMAQIRNRSGKWVDPSLDNTAAAADVTSLPDDMQYLITDSPNPNAYPIAGFSWLLIYENQQYEAQGRAVAQLAWWMIHDGQKFNQPLLYANIKGSALAKSEALLRQIKVKGKPALTE